MACMKLGTKPDAFRLEDHTWQCTTGLPSDVTIEIGETSFNLHKFPLISRSGLLTKLIGDNPEEDGPICTVHLNDIPGGCQAFELIAKFCYCVKLELTSHNVISIRCAADYLQMTDDYGDENLITQTEIFLKEVFTTWSDTMDALESCEEVLSDAEDLDLITRCIDSLAIKACSGQNPYNPHATSAVNNHDNNITQSSIIWNGIPTSNKPQTSGDDWWYKDVSFLGLHLYKRVIQAMESVGMKAETIAGSLVGYAKKYIPLMNRQSSFNDASHSKPVSAPSAADQRALLEEIVELLPNRKGIVGTKFLIRLLRTALVLHVSPSCREILEKRVGAQLDSAVLDDILIPNQGFNSVDTLYDIDCFQRILDYFMSMDTTSTQCSPCIIEEGLDDGPQSLTSITSVANLVDSFLADVSADVNLKLSKFQSLAVAVPDYARPQSDGIYRALDIFLKAHPWLTDCEREQICRLMNIQKLSLDASTHAAQNERLPLRVIVQVLFFEQLRLRTSIAGWFFVSENLENSQDQTNDKNDGEVGRSQGRRGEMTVMSEMRERVVDLERECANMKYEMRKMAKKKTSWNFFCKRRRHR